MTDYESDEVFLWLKDTIGLWNSIKDKASRHISEYSLMILRYCPVKVGDLCLYIFVDDNRPLTIEDVINENYNRLHFPVMKSNYHFYTKPMLRFGKIASLHFENGRFCYGIEKWLKHWEQPHTQKNILKTNGHPVIACIIESLEPLKFKEIYEKYRIKEIERIAESSEIQEISKEKEDKSQGEVKAMETTQKSEG